MPFIDKLAADTPVLLANVNALLAAAAVVVADGTGGVSQPHLDTLNATIAAVFVTRARMSRVSDQP
jgi:hypothetical protein